MSTTDIKRDVTSETVENVPFLLHSARHFNVEACHARSLTLVTDSRADKAFISPVMYLADRRAG